MRASRKYLECHSKEIWENGKSQLRRKKAFLEEKPLSLESTLILTGISVNPNNRLKIGTSGEIPSFDLLRQLRQVFPTDQVITEANDARVFYEQLLV